MIDLSDLIIGCGVCFFAGIILGVILAIREYRNTLDGYRVKYGFDKELERKYEKSDKAVERRNYYFTRRLMRRNKEL